MLHSVLTARRLAVLAQLAAVAACGGPKISRKDAGGVIQGDQTFKSSKYVYLPRTVAIPADGIGLSAATREGEALTIIQIASVDPVVAVLRARGEVTIEDFVSAVPGSIVIPPPADEDTTSKKDSTAANDSAATKDTSRFETTRRNDSARAAQLAKPKKLDSYTSPLPVPPFAQQWVHTLRMTPHPRIMTADLGPDDGEDSDAPRNYGANNVSRTPG